MASCLIALGRQSVCEKMLLSWGQCYDRGNFSSECAVLHNRRCFLIKWPIFPEFLFAPKQDKMLVEIMRRIIVTLLLMADFFAE
jgi:hypothetical protein